MTALLARPEHATRADVHRTTRLLLVAFATLTLLAANQLLVLTAHTDRWFPWTVLAEPTAWTLGAAYAAGCVLSVMALVQRSWRRVQIVVRTVFVFTLLTLVATLVHAHLFHLAAEDPAARTAAWFWLVVYLAVPVVCLAVLAGQAGGPSQPRSDRRPVARPIPGWLTGLLAAQGAVFLAVGAALTVRGASMHHGQQVVGFWPWPLSPLSAQVMGAWLIAFGVAAFLVLRERDLREQLVLAVGYTAFGVFELLALFGVRGELDAGLSLWVMVAVLGSAVLAGAYGWWHATRPVTDPHTGNPPRRGAAGGSGRGLLREGYFRTG